MDEAIVRSFPVTIYRPGHIGASTRGKGNFRDHVELTLKAVWRLGIAPIGVEFLTTPLDILAADIFDLAHHPDSEGRSYNMLNRVHRVENNLIMDVYAQLGRPIRLVPRESWLTSIRAAANDGDGDLQLLAQLETKTNHGSESVVEDATVLPGNIDCGSAQEALGGNDGWRADHWLASLVQSFDESPRR